MSRLIEGQVGARAAVEDDVATPPTVVLPDARPDAAPPAATPVTRLRAAIVADDRLRVPLVVFLLSRVYVFMLGAIAMWINVTLPPVPALGFYMPELYGVAHYLLQPWRNWDGHWYTLLAREGYGYDQAATAFYPLYPLLLRGGTLLFDGQVELAGVLISNLCFLGALVVLYRLVELDFSASIARRTLLYLALFPTAYYFSAVYSESLFLFLAVACLYAARRDRWWLAGLCGFLASLTRTHGILLLLPLVIFFVRQHGWRPRQWRANPASLALVPAGLMVYMVYLRRVWDDPLMMIRAQKGWDRYSAKPWETITTGVKQLNGCAVQDWNVGITTCWKDQFLAHPGLATIRDLNWRWGLSESNVVELVFTIFLIVLGLAALRYLPLGYSSYLVAGIILPLWSPSHVHALMSMHRFTLILFPAFIVLALVGRWRVAHATIIVVSALLLAFFINQFASWLWVA